ncbi:GNAT family N-acetyltransferase [Williamsia deligens]|uniref:GNAT family N-acetyltransferase n=1 Tax=Williamsia deligens TaxID=321325 RepID=A0ABW3G899_9NOCA|nr:GNAT family N-acetyltransferase [Williamsia deligens]MCP2194142.1 Acetyltransferase (GNAT) family protein [Williamsia deligens]
MDDGLRLLDNLPGLDDYRRLRAVSGLTPVTEDQARPALANAWGGCHVVDASGAVVAMGRVLGDGGWYFHITDIATDPDHQRRGLGTAVVQRLLTLIVDAAPPHPYITLMADPPGRALYESMGFETTKSTGMVQTAIRRGEPAPAGAVRGPGTRPS